MLRSRLVSLVLLACAVCAYLGILEQGRRARERVVDTVAYGASLASDGHGATNTSFDPATGSAAIGVNYRVPSAATWTIVPVAHDSSVRRWLYVMADQPEFYAPSASLSITAGSETVGSIRARPSGDGSTFTADSKPYPIAIPPSQTFGYRFALDDDRICSDAPCAVTVSGASTFWHIDRISLVGERPRFIADSAR